MPSEAQKRANKNYRKKLNRLTLDFSPAEQEMWEHIQSQPKKQTYIKDLISADIKAVRCKDCKYCNPFGECSHPALCSDDSQSFIQVGVDDSCTRGEKNTEESK